MNSPPSSCPVTIRAKLRNSNSGLGIVLSQRSDEPPALQVSKLVRGSEADLSGLVRPGDIILQLNDEDVSRCSYEHGLSLFKSLPAEEMVRLVLRAPFGYTTRLETTFAEDGLPRTFRITERIYSGGTLHENRICPFTKGLTSNGPLVELNLNQSQDQQKCGNTNGPAQREIHRRPVRLQNVASTATAVDTLHQTHIESIGCTNKVCSGSLMNWKKEKLSKRGTRSTEEVAHHARNFLDQYYTSIKRLNSEAHEKRLAEVMQEISSTGTYNLKETELIFGAKLAWRNAPRCIGRIQWSKLQVFDFRFVSTAREMFEAICNHIKYATNKGNLRSAITIFPPRFGDPKNDFRVWNAQLISYAGYVDEHDPKKIIGDPMNVEFTQLCEKLGWKGARTRFDILPLVLSAAGQDPQLFLLPEELVLRVKLKHPKFDWWDSMGLEWYALPAVSSMLLDVGGLEFPAVPFSGWYMVTEIAMRDLCDTHRYNILEEVATLMGLDTRSNTTLWKDAAAVEVNISVLDSFQKACVTIVDHHTASESFMKHLENEQRLRGGCPADWVWVVPPMSSSLTPVFHQEMLYYEMKPSYEYQESPMKTHQWQKLPGTERNTPGRKIRFKEIARAVKFTSNLFGKALSKRIKATILFATETGRSEHYAKRLSTIFSHAFNVTVLCMADYDTFQLEHEALLLIVTSTFGNGDPPENGESFARQLQAIKVTGDTTPDIESIRSISMSYLRIASVDSVDGVNTPPPFEDSVSQVGPLSNIRFSVFALGSSAYPNFCAFGRFIDTMLADLGGERISKVATGDELCGLEQSFNDWSKKVFEEACEVFCIGDEVNLEAVLKSANLKPTSFATDNVRLVEQTEQCDDLSKGLSKGSNRKLVKLSVLNVMPLYEIEDDDRKTILVELEAMDDSNFAYLPGDHLGVYPENSSALINVIVDRLPDINFDQVYKVLTKTVTSDGGKEEWVPHERLPAISLREALKRYFDITTPPTQQLLSLLSTFAQDERERNELTHLATDSRKYEEWRAKHFGFARILQQFTSLKPKAEFIFTQLTPLQPRFYSISSAPNYNHLVSSLDGAGPVKKLSIKSKSMSRPNTPTRQRRVLSDRARTQPGTPTGTQSGINLPGANCQRVDLTVAVVKYTQNGIEHEGVCSTFLARAQPGHTLYGFIRSAPNFRLPDKQDDCPVIMVGPGSGIAPFRAFWLSRYATMITTERRFGPMSLFFGCRLPSMQLYKEEISKMISEGVFTEVYTAFSRQPGKSKEYVQDYLLKASQTVYQQLMHEKAHFYVCGDVSMAEDVCKTLKLILADNGIDDPEAAIINLRETLRYHEDIFGITLRTEQQVRKGRSDALRRSNSSQNEK